MSKKVLTYHCKKPYEYSNNLFDTLTQFDITVQEAVDPLCPGQKVFMVI